MKIKSADLVAYKQIWWRCYSTKFMVAFLLSSKTPLNSSNNTGLTCTCSPNPLSSITALILLMWYQTEKHSALYSGIYIQYWSNKVKPRGHSLHVILTHWDFLWLLNSITKKQKETINSKAIALASRKRRLLNVGSETRNYASLSLKICCVRDIINICSISRAFAHFYYKLCFF